MPKLAPIDVAAERDALKAEIKAVEKKLQALHSQLAAVDEIFQEEVGRVYDGVIIKTRKASYVFIAPNGKSAVMPIQKNSYGERTVYWYDGKKGAVALENTRYSSNNVARWLNKQ